MKTNEKMDVVILCGGMGTRMREETETRPKPMADVGGRPPLWHIMKNYSHFGFSRFILALGYKADYIKKYFYDYGYLTSDLTIVLDPKVPPRVHSMSQENHWEITCVDTGLSTLKGGRVKRIERYLQTDSFHLT